MCPVTGRGTEISKGLSGWMSQGWMEQTARLQGETTASCLFSGYLCHGVGEGPPPGRQPRHYQACSRFSYKLAKFNLPMPSSPCCRGRTLCSPQRRSQMPSLPVWTEAEPKCLGRFGLSACRLCRALPGAGSPGGCLELTLACEPDRREGLAVGRQGRGTPSAGDLTAGGALICPDF